MARDERHTAQSALARAYSPEPKIRVGILLIAGALSASQSTAAVDDALMAAGHAPLRRRAQLQPRTGENEPRVADVIEFLTLFGHEYAAVAFRTWPAAHGHEEELTAAAKRAGCRTIWELRPSDPAPAFDAVGSDIVLR
jgi:hypothetical protein